MADSRSRGATSYDTVSLAHLSDLHFSEHAACDTADSCHSVDHLIDLKRALQRIHFDRLIVSGDLSDRGNRDALLRARDYLFREYSIGNGQTVGLELDPQMVHMVPGNHDAFNTAVNGDTVTRWQRSLANYNWAFPDHYLRNKGCGYIWIDRGDWGVYIAFADTCFLGDPVLENHANVVPSFSAVAKGKLAQLQAQRLLKWFDLGMRGNLPRPDGPGTISATKFGKSFKMLVMHHYVFEPANCKLDHLMSMHDRHDVFRNIALCNFDVLLCGHKHIPDFSDHTYGYHLERRGKHRYLANMFRRAVGISSLPIRFTGRDGKHFSRHLSWIAQGLLKLVHKKTPADLDAECTELAGILVAGLEDPAALRRRIREMVHRLALKPEEVPLTTDEVKRVEYHLSKRLTVPQRKQLSESLSDFNKIVGQLKTRPFVQVMAGSACKRPANKDKPRAFNLHTITRIDSSYHFVSERYQWNYQINRFVDDPVTGSMIFRTVL